MSAHNRLHPPSAAKRWLGDGDSERPGCSASVNLIAELPQEVSASQYAAEGTVAHDVLAQKQSERDVDPVGSVVECDGYDIIVDQEMHDHADWAIERIAATLPAGARVLREWIDHRVTIHGPDGTPMTDGTGDYMRLLMHSGSLVFQVYDYKYGKGVAVPASDPQLRLYGLGGIDEVQEQLLEDVDVVECHVLQPRIRHTHDVATYGRNDMEMFRDRVHAATVEAQQDPQFRPHEDACRWCPLKPCRALAELVDTTIEVDAGFDPVEGDVSNTVYLLAPADLGRLLDRAPLIEQLLNAAAERAERMLHEGDEVPGRKLVLGKQGNRAWVSEAAALAFIKKSRTLKTADFAPPKLVSPTQAEKLNRAYYAEHLAELVTRAPAKPIMVAEDDPRDTWTPDGVGADAEFNDVDSEEDDLLA